MASLGDAPAASAELGGQLAAVVTGRSQTKPRQTYAVAAPSSSGRSASSGTPGWSGAPATTTAPGGACRRAAADAAGRRPASAVTIAISYGPESSASPTAAAYPVNRACRPTIGATVASAASAASR